MDDNILKKKKHKLQVKKYLYFSIISLFLLVGVAYAYIFFMERFQSNDLGVLVTALLDVDISENGRVSLVDAVGQTDYEGSENERTTFTIVNNNEIPIRVQIKLVPNENSTLDLYDVRFGVFANDNNLAVNSLGNTDGIIYDFFMTPGQTANLQTTIWLDYYYAGGENAEVFSGKYTVEAVNANQFAYAYLANLVGKGKGIYAINNAGTLASGTESVKEYRYSGLNPDNYVYFNNEVWRIVSASDTNIKIVRNETIPNASYINNNTYYASINATFKEYIASAEFNTGSINLTNTYATLLANEETTKTEGYINYISASDYLYSTDPMYYTSTLNNVNVANNTWLSGTYLTANGIQGGSNVLGINNNVPTSTTSSNAAYNIKPCLYLKQTVSIVGGNGTLEKPYELDYADVREYIEPETP